MIRSNIVSGTTSPVEFDFRNVDIKEYGVHFHQVQDVSERKYCGAASYFTRRGTVPGTVQVS